MTPMISIRNYQENLPLSTEENAMLVTYL